MINSKISAQTEIHNWTWRSLPGIPDTLGFAGAYAGHTAEGLYVLGGANFPDGKAPWDGGTKRWTDKVFYLKKGAEEWKFLGKLPQAMGYGGSASYKESLYIAGGSNEHGHLADVYKLDFYPDSMSVQELPALPAAIANVGSVRLGPYWYIMGGIIAADALVAENSCWRLDLENPALGWEVCPPIPGPGRMLAVAGAGKDRLYVFSGVSLENGKRKYLTDAYVFDKKGKWHALTNLPDPVAAAPSPAFYHGATGTFYIFGGDDGRLANENLKEKHPGFSDDILTFTIPDGKWNRHGHIPTDIKSDAKEKNINNWMAPVTTTAINLEDCVILPQGEIRPAIRTPHVIVGYPIENRK